MNRQFRFVFRRGATIRSLALGAMVALANLTPSEGHAQSTERTPAATLGQPRPAASLSGTIRPVVRASPNDLSESSTETSVADRKDLDPWKKESSSAKPTEYPPTYSSTKKELMPKVLGDLWKKSGKETNFTPPTSTDGKQTYRDPRRPATEPPAPQEKIKPNETLPMPKPASDAKPPIIQKVIPGPVTNFAVPAWRWYGYGTITPGVSTSSGDGTYPLAPIHWLQETKATPGAIPQGFVTSKVSSGLRDAPPNYVREDKIEPPTRRMELQSRPKEEPIMVLVPQEESPRIEPPPTELPPIRGIPLTPLPSESDPIVEPKRSLAPVDDFVLPPRLPPTGAPMTQKDGRGGTTIYFPVPGTPAPKASLGGTVQPKSLPPTSMRSGPRANDVRLLVRAQAPSAQPESFINSLTLAPKLEQAARGAREVHVHLTQTNRIGIRLIVPPGVDFELIADRIGAIPELARFYLDFDVTVR